MNHFKKFADCIPVKGASRSVICDLTRGEYQYIPNGLYEILETYEGEQLDTIKKDYNSTLYPIIDEYFNFLLEHDYIFWIDKEDAELFPPIDLQWQTPSIITNTIIDITADSNHNFNHIFKQIERVSCRFIQIRSFSPQPVAFWQKILNSIKTSEIQYIELLTPYTDEYTITAIEPLLEQHLRVRNLVLYGSDKSELIQAKGSLNGNVIYLKNMIKSPKDCQVISPKYFFTNPELFSEAQHFHTYYNRKVAIDWDGAIKNCTQLKESYGNIYTDDLLHIVRTATFQKYWTITKDKIKVCQDCEYRYMCVDSCPLESIGAELWQKTVPCDYDPYTAKWRWET